MDQTINNFTDFCNILLDCGFSMGGGNAKGIFAIIPYTWENQDAVDTVIKWHSEDPETDPWEWRMRVLEERNDIAYSKVFFRTSGYITREWYPYFLSVRRGKESLEESYYDGKISQTAKQIYQIISEHHSIAMHDIKKLGGFTKEDNSLFDRSLVELQMKLFITMCGRSQKTNQLGEGYGWNSTVFCTTEQFWGEEMIDDGGKIPKEEAIDKITRQIYGLNPDADQKKIKKFITG